MEQTSQPSVEKQPLTDEALRQKALNIIDRDPAMKAKYDRLITENPAEAEKFIILRVEAIKKGPKERWTMKN